ncbi:hypothetical protein ACWEO1_13625 [Kitasatospora cineracea]
METENSITGGSFAAGVLQVGSLSLDKPATRPSGLPPRGLFVGREPLLADLVTELATGEGPLLVSALAGLGGIGKTALAVEAAHRTRHLFPGGTSSSTCAATTSTPSAPSRLSTPCCAPSASPSRPRTRPPSSTATAPASPPPPARCC